MTVLHNTELNRTCYKHLKFLNKCKNILLNFNNLLYYNIVLELQTDEKIFL